MLKSTNFLTIQGWMRTKLGLKGNDLLVYAIIYGFSQDDDQVFSGSLKYLAEWTGATKEGVRKNLKSLLDKDLIRKETEVKNNITFCKYWVNPRMVPVME